MTAGGEAHDADALRIEMPLGGVRVDSGEGVLRIDKRRAIAGSVRGRRHAVFHESGVDTDAIEPLADLAAFEIEREDAIAPAGENYDGSA